MGKHKNATQNTILIEFMEEYPDIAQGFTKRDKPSVDALWQQLVESLNSAGPPQKDAHAWKKTWAEWKSDVKKKLAKNNTESRGPFSKVQLTQTEQSLVRICALSKAVAGVAGNAPGLPKERDDEMPSTSSKRQMSPIASTPKRPRSESTGERLKKFLDEDNDRKLEITARLDDLVKIEKENASSLRRVYRAIEKSNEGIANAVTNLKDEYVRINTGVLRALKDSNSNSNFKSLIMRRKKEVIYSFKELHLRMDNYHPH